MEIVHDSFAFNSKLAAALRTAAIWMRSAIFRRKTSSAPSSTVSGTAGASASATARKKPIRLRSNDTARDKGATDLSLARRAGEGWGPLQGNGRVRGLSASLKTDHSNPSSTLRLWYALFSFIDDGVCSYCKLLNTNKNRHSGESRNRPLEGANWTVATGVAKQSWVPAFAGMTKTV